ncbi:hypothetical protein VNI00_018588 [Paramarasmius palmivorus]|uniref:F-box domain-containing protein n=1 Tax=Paramarasmius palmivorus TaxID=297713 RepID=A0AAW0AXS8_9AGAR
MAPLHPLRIKISGYEQSITRFGVGALCMIFQELQRCEMLEFDGDWTMLARFVPCTTALSFPQLRSFTASACLGELVQGIGLVSPILRWFTYALQNAPRLVDVRVELPKIGIPNVLPYRQLTVIRVHTLKVAQVTHILWLCPNLKELEVDILMPNQADFAHGAILHSNLQRLTIRSHLNWLADFTRSLALHALPVLRVFRLEIIPDQTLVYPRLPSSFFTMMRNLLSLEEFRLDSGLLCMHQTWCTDILELCPNIRSLEIDIEPGNDSEYILHLIQNLTIRSAPSRTSAPAFAPKLTSLHLVEFDTYIRPTYIFAFLDMVESRRDGAPGIAFERLAKAELRFTTRLDNDRILHCCISDPLIRQRIKLLSEGGIECSIGTLYRKTLAHIALPS